MTTAGTRAGRSRAVRPGLVSLVGAGPGDPSLLTRRAADRLARADLVLYDGLVPADVLALARRARCESVARRVGRKELSHGTVIARMIDASRRGRRVVRLKSGDPFVFGRGGEEVQALAAAGVPYEVVPGLSTALVAPLAAGIPVTHRGVSTAVVVVSGHSARAYGPVLRSVPPGEATIVVLMGLGSRRAIARCLMAAGWTATTPAALVINASQPRQRVWTGTLQTLGKRDGLGSREEPGVIVVGDVVSEASRPNATLVMKAEE